MIGYLRTIRELIKRDLYLFWKDFHGCFLDSVICLATTVCIFSYFLPHYGLDNNYGPFILVGAIASFGLFNAVGKLSLLLADIEGDRTILFTLHLPLPASLVFSYIALSWGLQAFITGALLFPLGKLFLWHQFDITRICYIELVLIFIASHLFFGFFALWIASVLKKMNNLVHLFVRIVNPMYMFGCYFYSWHSVYALSPWIGIAHLLNPMMFVMEGMRHAALGDLQTIPFGYAILGLVFFTALCAWDAIRRLKKRLDCV